MTLSIMPAEDGSYVDVFVLIAFKRVDGRKTIVAPDWDPVVARPNKATDSTLIKALSHVWRWQQLLDGESTAASPRWPTRRASTGPTSRARPAPSHLSSLGMLT
jgi:hypothetical protein